MNKIPTLFRRNPDNRRHLLPEVHPQCQWVLDGEGVPTRKYDGTCVMFDGTTWWARREVKLGKATPPGFNLVQFDSETGKAVGWEPIPASSFFRYFDEARQDAPDEMEPGTYELIGPKVNGNPEAVPKHRLVRHADALDLAEPVGGRTFEALKRQVTNMHQATGVEGIVWHHPDGRMAKLKARDFR